MVKVREAEPGDALWFTPRLRQADIDELTAASGPDIERTLAEALDLSPRAAFVAVSPIYGPICLFGFAAFTRLGRRAAPWAVGTEQLRLHGRSLNHFGRLYCAAALEEYDTLVNYVDDRHIESRRWLQRIGFLMGEPEPFGVARLPFRRFEMRREHV